MMRLIGASLVYSRPTQNRSGPIALSLFFLLYKLLVLDRLAALASGRDGRDRLVSQRHY
jgi:hypothetical protein